MSLDNITKSNIDKIKGLIYHFNNFSLNPQSDSLYQKYLKELESTKDANHEKLRQWAKDESLIVKDHFQFEINQADSDFEFQKQLLSTKYKEIIQGKALALTMAFPSAENFFRGKFFTPFSTSFTSQINTPTYHLDSFFPDNRQKIIVEPHLITIGPFSFSEKSSCKIQFFNEEFFSGIIDSWDPPLINIQFSTGDIIHIPFEMIIHNFVIITKC